MYQCPNGMLHHCLGFGHTYGRCCWQCGGKLGQGWRWWWQWLHALRARWWWQWRWHRWENYDNEEEGNNDDGRGQCNSQGDPPVSGWQQWQMMIWTRTRMSRGDVRRRCCLHWPPGTTVGRGRGLGGSNPIQWFPLQWRWYRLWRGLGRWQRRRQKWWLWEQWWRKQRGHISDTWTWKSTSHASFIYVYVMSPKPRNSTQIHGISAQ